MKWVDNPKEIWKKYSTIALAVLTLAPEVWAMSPELQAMLPAETALRVASWIAMLGLIGRFIKQIPKSEDPK